MMAGPVCTVCSHPGRIEIEAALVQGLSQRQVATDWGVTRFAVARHRQNHLSPAVKALRTRRESDGARTGQQRLEELADTAQEVLELARGHADGAKPDGKLMLESIKRLESIVTTIMRTTGELDERPQINVLNLSSNPEWVEIRSLLMVALAPHPAAAEAAAVALAGMASSSVRELTR